MNPTPQTDQYKEAAQKTVDYLYSLGDDCPNELRQPIASLRQLVNEEFVHKDTSVSSQLIWDILKQSLMQYIEKRDAEGKVGWTLEAPDLPYFQISFFNKNNTAFNNDEPYASWTSPIMDTKDLPLQINKLTNLKEGNHD